MQKTSTPATEYVTAHLNNLARLMLICIEEGADKNTALAEVAWFVSIDADVPIVDARRACQVLLEEPN